MGVLRQRLSVRSASLVTLEALLLVSAVLAASYARLGDETADIMLGENGVAKALLVVFIAQVCLYCADLYDLRQVADRRELFIRIIQALASASFLLAAVYYWFP